MERPCQARGILQAEACLFFLCLAGNVRALAQSADLSTIHVDTRVVQVEVTATDSHGNSIAGLGSSDFTLMDDGKPRHIDIFSVETAEDTDHHPTAKPEPVSKVFSNRQPSPDQDRSHSTAILLDASKGGSVSFQWARQAVIAALKKIPPDERIALYVIALRQGLVLLQDYTTNRDLLLRRLSGFIVRPPPPAPPRGQSLTVEEAGYLAREASENVRLSLDGLAGHLSLGPGRKNVILLTDGMSPKQIQDGQTAWEKTFAVLNEANVAVNTIDTVGVSVNRAGNLTVEQMIAESTGGRAYFGRNDADQMLNEEIASSRQVYVLGFYLLDNERDDKFHTLSVTTRHSGSSLSHRKGYYAGETELPPSFSQKRGREDVESSLLNTSNARGVGITAQIDSLRLVPQPLLDIRLNVDPETLLLTAQRSGWKAKVNETFIQVNESGDTLARISDDKDIEITEKNRPDYLAHGVVWPFSMRFIPGAVKLLIVVWDVNSGRVGSLAMPLTPPR
jgi:VWFA-related protein